MGRACCAAVHGRVPAAYRVRPCGKVRVWSWRVGLTAFPEQQTRPESGWAQEEHSGVCGATGASPRLREPEQPRHAPPPCREQPSSRAECCSRRPRRPSGHSKGLWNLIPGTGFISLPLMLST